MNTVEEISVCVLLVAFVLQMVYWLFIMTRIRRGPRDLSSALKPVSVIICGRNEAENLMQLVPALLEQKYAAEKQIIIVDDCSTDDTPLTIARMRAAYPEIYTTTIPGDAKFKHGKKLAISVGIKAAKFEHMIFIDADCVPASSNWLTSVMEHYADGRKRLVIGYGRYAKHSGLLNLLIRYETFWNAIQYLGFAVAFKPFMGVGRNLSYTKSLYDESSKFRNNLHLLSGDDDMFVSEMGTRANTAINFIREGQTISEPESTWMGYSAQKSRHLTTASLYPKRVKAMLGMEQVSRAAYWVALAAVFGILCAQGLPMSPIMWIACGALAVRTITMYIILGLSARNMGESKMWLLALPFDIIIPLMELSAWATGSLTQKSYKWK